MSSLVVVMAVKSLTEGVCIVVFLSLLRCLSSFLTLVFWPCVDLGGGVKVMYLGSIITGVTQIEAGQLVFDCGESF